jgi:tetratricopeptide (TPR) repeat protein
MPRLTPGRRRLLLALFTLAVAGLLLAGLELGLRLGGFGHSPHFFRKTTTPDGEVVWRENRNFTTPFFGEALVRRPLPVRLPLKKAPGTVRLFVLGSSAAMGDPEPAFSLARVLEAQLRHAYPQIRFEVINAAVTAINSHLVRGIAEDCAALEPDLFIVYEGHNEVIGPFGPAGVFAPFLRRETAVHATVWLKGTRLAQLAARFGRKTGAPEDWGGMEMFLRQQISSDDPRLSIVRSHFRANLVAISESARRVGATTLLCTVATNQRDFAPFLSADGEAEQAYQQARLALDGGRDSEARSLFQRALDLDTLRFRADSGLNQVIHELGAEVRNTNFQPDSSGRSTPGKVRNTNFAGLEVVDAAAVLADKSPHGVCGNELLYEHVHLTLRGTWEVAQALLPRIVADLERRRLVTAPPPAWLNLEETGLRLGYNTHEQAMIALELVNRFSKPPFTGQSDHAARLAAWQRRANAAQALLSRPDATAALHELGRRALDASPDDWLLARNTGAMLVARQQPAEALPLLQRAAAWIDDDVDTLVALGWAHHALGQNTEAETAFAKVRALEPNYPNLPKPGAP